MNTVSPEEVASRELLRLNQVWHSGLPSEDKRVEILTRIQELSIELNLFRQCPFCHRPLVYLEYDKALIPGHVYSEAGLTELKITGMCEHCSDEVTKEPEEECPGHYDNANTLFQCNGECLYEEVPDDEEM